MKPIPVLNKVQIIKFLMKIHHRGVDDCWEWIADTDSQGYGYAYLFQRTYLAHRVAYWVYYKQQPGELFVCHTCDYPSCCNTHHLFLGTQQDNLSDAAVKGRMSRGEQHGRARLTEQQVLEIRSRWPQETQTSLSSEYGIDQTTISLIVNRQKWKHI